MEKILKWMPWIFWLSLRTRNIHSIPHCKLWRPTASHDKYGMWSNAICDTRAPLREANPTPRMVASANCCEDMGILQTWAVKWPKCIGSSPPLMTNQPCGSQVGSGCECPLWGDANRYLAPPPSHPHRAHRSLCCRRSKRQCGASLRGQYRPCADR